MTHPRISVTVEFKKTSISNEGGFPTRIDEGCTLEDLAEQEGINPRKNDILVNGEPESLNYVLENGDHITVVTRNYNSGLAA